MERLYVKVDSWHIAEGDPPVETLCGLDPQDVEDAGPTFPGHEKTCEICFRIAAKAIDDAAAQKTAGEVADEAIATGEV